MSNRETSEKPECPVGESACIVIDQVQALKTEVETLSELIRTDNLTGLYNQRYLIDTLHLEMERTRRTGRFTALIMFDLDHFKQVNDTWGHESGNAVLKAAANVVSNTVRKLDVACRYGGEEFVVILPNTGLIEAAFVAERIRSQFESCQVPVSEGVINFTASFGVEIFTEHNESTVEEFIASADSYLYEAKLNGRNQVCHVPAEKIKHEPQISVDERDAIFGLFGDAE